MTTPFEPAVLKLLHERGYQTKELGQESEIVCGIERNQRYLSVSRGDRSLEQQDCIQISRIFMLYGYLCLWDETFRDIYLMAAPHSKAIIGKMGIIVLEMDAMRDALTRVASFATHLETFHPPSKKNATVTNLVTRTTAFHQELATFCQPSGRSDVRLQLRECLKQGQGIRQEYRTLCQEQGKSEYASSEYLAFVDTVIQPNALISLIFITEDLP